MEGEVVQDQVVITGRNPDYQAFHVNAQFVQKVGKWKPRLKTG